MVKFSINFVPSVLTLGYTLVEPSVSQYGFYLKNEYGPTANFLFDGYAAGVDIDLDIVVVVNPPVQTQVASDTQNSLAEILTLAPTGGAQLSGYGWEITFVDNGDIDRIVNIHLDGVFPAPLNPSDLRVVIADAPDRTEINYPIDVAHPITEGPLVGSSTPLVNGLDYQAKIPRGLISSKYYIVITNVSQQEIYVQGTRVGPLTQVFSIDGKNNIMALGGAKMIGKITIN